MHPVVAEYADAELDSYLYTRGLRFRLRGQREQEDEEPEGNDDDYRGIVSGEPADAADYPWYAKFEGGILCGASVVGDGSFLLTAAHCLTNSMPSQVRVGSPLYSIGGTLYTVTKKWIHPNYEASQLLNDVALLKIATTCICTPPSVILNREQDFPSTTGHFLTVIGFGRTSHGGSLAGSLQQLEVSFVNNQECSDNHGRFETEMKMCADKDAAGVCNGDSGSPLLDINRETGQKTQVGIVSYGKVSCASSYPDYYARVSNYIEWIESTMSTEMETFGPDKEAIFTFLRRNTRQWMESSWHSFVGPSV